MGGGGIGERQTAFEPNIQEGIYHVEADIDRSIIMNWIVKK
jgi:hypothetical protein